MAKREILNLTPHPITYHGEEGEEVFPPSGTVLRVETEEEEPFEIEGLKTIKTIYGNLKGLSYGYLCPSCGGYSNPGGCRDCWSDTIPSVEIEGTVYINPIMIVSSMVKNAIEETELGKNFTIIVPDTGKSCIRDENGRITAVTQFRR